MNRSSSRFATAFTLFLMFAAPVNAQEAKRITILYDAFGAPSALVKDWGFAALVEYGGKRILFDTGNNAQTFEHNAKQLSIELKRLDAVVISHRHGDHTSGLNYLLRVNSDVKIYAPQESSFFKAPMSLGFLAPYPGLPAELRYYDGKPPEQLVSGTPWEKGNFEIVTKTLEIFPGLFVLTTRSQKPGTLEMSEVSLAIRTPKGLAVVVGCSHPGVEHIVQEATAINPRINILFGGFHQIQAPDPEVESIATVLHNQYRLERVAPGHCTGEPEFAALKKTFGDNYVYAGVGSVVDLPK